MTVKLKIKIISDAGNMKQTETAENKTETGENTPGSKDQMVSSCIYFLKPQQVRQQQGEINC